MNQQELNKRDADVLAYIREILQGACNNTDDVAKYAIIWTQFFNEVSPFLKKLSTKELRQFAFKYLHTMIHFETLCVRTYKPSGSQNMAKEIMNMYSSRHLVDETNLLK